MSQLVWKNNKYHLRIRKTVNGKNCEKQFRLSITDKTLVSHLKDRVDFLIDTNQIDPFSNWTPEGLELQLLRIRKSRGFTTLLDAQNIFLRNRPEVREVTRKGYYRHTQMLIKKLGPDTPLWNITEEHIREMCFQDGINISTQVSYLRHYKAFFNWLEFNGYIEYNPTKRIRMPKIPSSMSKKYFTRSQFNTLLSTHESYIAHWIEKGSIVKKDQEQLWFRPLMFLLYFTGARISEALRIEWDDIVLRNGEWFGIHILNKKFALTKSARERYVTMRKELRKELELWHIKCGKPSTGLIFPSAKSYLDNQPMHAPRVSRTFKKMLRLAELPEHLVMHDLRHTCITDLVKNGVSGEIVQQFAGHADYKTTLIYIHLDNSDIDNAISKLDEH